MIMSTAADDDLSHKGGDDEDDDEDEWLRALLGCLLWLDLEWRELLLVCLAGSATAKEFAMLLYCSNALQNSIKLRQSTTIAWIP